MRNYKKKLAALLAIGLTAAQAQAALTVPTLDTGDTVEVAGAVLAGFAIIWGVKRAIGLMAK